MVEDYFSTGGQRLQIAKVNDVVGALYPPNQIIYVGCLEASDNLQGIAVEGDLVYTSAKAGMEQDIAVTGALPDPLTLGFKSAAGIKLEAWTEFIQPPTPKIRTKVIPLLPNLDSGQAAGTTLVDDTVDWGDAWMPLGRAYLTHAELNARGNSPAQVRLADPANPDDVLVAKKWVSATDGNAVLIETVELTELNAKFNVLKQASVQPKDGVAGFRQALTTSPQDFHSAPKKVELAQVPYTPKGWVLDYILSGTSGSYTFTNGFTYLITNSFMVGDSGGGTANFQPNACVKYATNAYLMLIGGVSFQTNGSPTVFTSKDDDCYGTVITDTGYGSTGIPTNSYGPGLSVYFPGHSVTIANARIRWSKRAISMSESSGIVVSHAVKNSKFENNWHGIYEYLPSGSLTLTADTYINQSSNVYNPMGSLSGSLTASGDVVNTSKLKGFSEQETTVAINPLNTSNIVACSMCCDSNDTYRLFKSVSTNAGSTWSTNIFASGQAGDLPQGFCDEKVKFDKYGNLFLSYLGPDQARQTNIVVALSTNGGVGTNFTAIP